MMALGYILAMVMRLALGIIDAGGSILLTVPILLYLFGVNPGVAPQSIHY